MFPKEMALSRKRVRTEAKGCVILRLGKPISKQIVDDMVASGMEEIEAREAPQSTKRSGLEATSTLEKLSGETQ